jgi:hypothetical protein
VLDSAFDLIIFGLLSVVAVKGVSGILLASSFIALIGTLTPLQKKVKERAENGNKTA